jgi:hypothetical protein
MTARKSRRAVGKAGGHADPELVDRLKRAVGAYQLRTGTTKTWKELGELAHLTPQSMTDVLRCKRKVTITDARIWADALGVEFSWLAIGRGPMIVMTQDDASRYGAPPRGEPASAVFSRLRSEAQKRSGRTGS